MCEVKVRAATLLLHYLEKGRKSIITSQNRKGTRSEEQGRITNKIHLSNTRSPRMCFFRVE